MPKNRIVTIGAARQISMKPVQKAAISGWLERRPSARSSPSGTETTIAMKDSTKLRRSPPQSRVSTTGSPAKPPRRNSSAASG